MSAPIATKKTPAELRLIERAEAGTGQREALAALREAGLPSRRVEAWHYTDLRVLLDRAMQAGAPAGSDVESILAPLLPHSVVVEAGSAETISREGLSVAPSARIPEWTRALNHVGLIDLTEPFATAGDGAPSSLPLASLSSTPAVIVVSRKAPPGAEPISQRRPLHRTAT